MKLDLNYVSQMDILKIYFMKVNVNKYELVWNIGSEVIHILKCSVSYWLQSHPVFSKL